ncbi:MAG: hypothetical protein NTW66_01095 [Candidatus Magasanikbacteria bacterium]|nr:hypothetical protein [Candidatus Magasanikbacteria bacterium]
MKRATYVKFGLSLILATIISLLKIEAASAQLSISAYPLSVRGKLDPGQSMQANVTVTNPNDFDIRVRPEKENLSGGAEGVIQLQGEKDIPWGIASWIKFDDSNDFLLKPKEHRKVFFTIDVPANAEPGGHYGAVLFRALSATAEENEQSGVEVSGRVGSVLLFEISGNVINDATVSEIIAPKFIGHGPLKISFKFKNGGNSYFSPEGEVVYSNFWNKSYDAWRPRVVFPGFERTFDSAWNRKFLFGPVKITINSRVQENGLIIPAKSIIIWAFPWQEALIILAAILILLFGIKYFKKKFKIVRVE